MITVKEIVPRKISGLTSFLVSVDRFIPEIQDLVNSLTTQYYFKKEHCWEISSVDIKQFLDLATKLDDIHLELIENDFKEVFEVVTSKEQVELIKGQYKPFKHQIEAINYTLDKKKWLLLDSMGLGKTGSIIYSAEVLHKRGLIDHCLIICGVNAVKENWANEIQKFSDESYTILGKKIGKRGGVSYATISERCEILKKPIDEFFVITNIETIRDEKIVKAINSAKNKFGMIAVDEIHRCVTGDTQIITDIGNLTIADLAMMSSYPKILSYNTKTNKNEFKQINGVSVLQPNEPLVELTLIEANTEFKIKCTESHKIYTTNRGWVKAKDLVETDDIKIC